MESKFKTEQELFWAGGFGSEYTDRNENYKSISSRIARFSKIIGSTTTQVNSVLEFGSNIGFNLIALEYLLIDLELSAVEINKDAINALKEQRFKGKIKVYDASILDFVIDYQRDLVLSSGLLIHINPDFLPDAYEAIYNSSRSYICLIEYYNPTPVEVSYRGNEKKLFKRDFAGEMLDKYKDLNLVDYGFTYHRDINFPADDSNWFLLKKQVK